MTNKFFAFFGLSPTTKNAQLTVLVRDHTTLLLPQTVQHKLPNPLSPPGQLPFLTPCPLCLPHSHHHCPRPPPTALGSDMKSRLRDFDSDDLADACDCFEDALLAPPAPPAGSVLLAPGLGNCAPAKLAPSPRQSNLTALRCASAHSHSSSCYDYT